MSFPRHAEIYRSDGARTLESRGGVPPPVGRPPSPAKGRDRNAAPCSSSAMSFRAGYSLAGCSPAEPASASPTAPSMRWGISASKNLPASGNLSLVSVSQHRGAVQLGRIQREIGENWGSQSCGMSKTITLVVFESAFASFCSTSFRTGSARRIFSMVLRSGPPNSDGSEWLHPRSSSLSFSHNARFGNRCMRAAPLPPPAFRTSPFEPSAKRLSSSRRAQAVPSFTRAARVFSTAGAHALLYQRSTEFDPLPHIEAISSVTFRLSPSSQPTKRSYPSPDESQSRQYSATRSLKRPSATLTDEWMPTSSVARASRQPDPWPGLCAAILFSRSRSRWCQ